MRSKSTADASGMRKAAKNQRSERLKKRFSSECRVGPRKHYLAGMEMAFGRAPEKSDDGGQAAFEQPSLHVYSRGEEKKMEILREVQSPNKGRKKGITSNGISSRISSRRMRSNNNGNSCKTLRKQAEKS